MFIDAFIKPMGRVLRASTIALVVIFLSPIGQFYEDQKVMIEVHDRMEQFGGGGSLEEQCSSITFEDIFLYNQAIFEVRVKIGRAHV